MNLRTSFKLIASLAFASAIASSASAITKYYELAGDSSVDTTASAPGLSISTNILNIAGLNWNLDDGQNSGWFDFFKIWTDDNSIGSNDLDAFPIKASLSFSDPGYVADIEGETYGTGFALFLGYITEEGHVRWENPAPTFTLADRSFEVKLSDEDFNYGFIDLNEGEKWGATVQAKITQVSSSAVPDTGSTLALMGLALASIGFVARRKRA